MALSHFLAAILNIIFGGFEWILVNYLIQFVGNWYVTSFPMWAAMPHITFILAVSQWGIFLFVFIPTAIYLWSQTQRPEVQ